MFLGAIYEIETLSSFLKFQLYVIWDSDLSLYDSFQESLFRRDVVFKFCVMVSWMEHWKIKFVAYSGPNFARGDIIPLK